MRGCGNREGGEGIVEHRIAAVLIALASLDGAAATPPSRMMANVYRLTEAAAILSVCIESAAYRKLAAEKAREFEGLRSRIGDLVRGIGKHYSDDSLHATFEATRARMAGETAMRGYVHTKYQYCNDQLARDMDAYVAENEKLINDYFEKQSRGDKGKAK